MARANCMSSWSAIRRSQILAERCRRKTRNLLVGPALSPQPDFHEGDCGDIMAIDLKPDQKPIRQPASKRTAKLDELLDEALEDTFPASDPVSLSQPQKSPADRRSP